MQSALPAVSDRDHFWSAPSPVAAKARVLIAGVAIAGASVVAVNPVVPTLTEVKESAVELTAWANPVTTWENTLRTVFESAAARVADIENISIPAIGDIITNESIRTEFVRAITNPIPGFAEFLFDSPQYAVTLVEALGGSVVGGLLQSVMLPTAAIDIASQLINGGFTPAWGAVNYWAISTLADVGFPLLNAFRIPGDIARNFGADSIGNVIDALLVGTTAAGYAYSVLIPPLTAGYQIAESLDGMVAALSTGDLTTALSDFVNMPARVTNAFFNGYYTEYGGGQFLDGVFSEGGLVHGLFVGLPQAIAEALNGGPVEQPLAGAAAGTAALARVASADVAAADETVTVNIDAEGSGATGGDDTVPGSATEEDADSAPTTARGLASEEAAPESAEAVTATPVKTTSTTRISEPADSEDGKSEKSESGSSTSGGTTSDSRRSAKSAKAESAKSESAKADSGKSDSSKSDRSGGGKSDRSGSSSDD